MKIYSWNVNGIRAVQKKGFIDWVIKEQPDILCLQETKANPGQLSQELVNIESYRSYWHWADKAGYSGVAIYTRRPPRKVVRHTGVERIDSEGRLIISEHEEFVLFNIYFPNGQMSQERLNYKLDFYHNIIEICDQWKKRGHKVIICGDFNTAHREIDLKHAAANQSRSGFLPVEREMLDKFLSHGYIDIYRHLYPEKVQYSWWSMRTKARERDIGWRIDYFYISENLLPDVEDCRIMDRIEGSDHCPIALLLK